MKKRGKKFDPLSNVQTTKVVYALLQGNKTIKSMAKALELTPQSIVDHINKLKKIKIIGMEKKEGKYVYYCIKNQQIINLFFDHFSSLKKSSLRDTFMIKATTKELKIDPGAEKTTQEDIKECIKLGDKNLKVYLNKLRKNKAFQNIVINYFYMLANSMPLPHTPTKTISEAADKFQDVLVVLYPEIKKVPKETEKKKLIKLLKIWYDQTHSYYNFFTQRALKEALKKEDMI